MSTQLWYSFNALKEKLEHAINKYGEADLDDPALEHLRQIKECAARLVAEAEAALVSEDRCNISAHPGTSPVGFRCTLRYRHLGACDYGPEYRKHVEAHT